MEQAYLVMVTPGDNHNKYYKMTQNGSTFTAEYGRVGASPQRKVYPMTRWPSIYTQKIQKGYVDQTGLRSGRVVTVADYKEIEDAEVRRLVDILLYAAKQTIKRNYRTTVDEVTPAMIKEASRLIHSLDASMDADSFNRVLLELFAVIPRRMSRVDDFLARSSDPAVYAKILEREQGILDAMSGQVYTSGKAALAAEAQGEPKQTILDSVGLSIRPCTDKENAEIVSHMRAEAARHFARAFRIYNKEASDRLEQYREENSIQKAHYFYHGSRTCNYWNILAMGLDINPNALTAGKMFGNGTYFANKAKKSMRYTDLPGQNNVHATSGDSAYLSVFKVVYKNAMDIYHWQNEYTRLNYRALNVKGYDAVFAHGGVDLVNDEIIVYQNCQSAPHYIIELK